MINRDAIIAFMLALICLTINIIIIIKLTEQQIYNKKDIELLIIGYIFSTIFFNLFIIITIINFRYPITNRNE